MGGRGMTDTTTLPLGYYALSDPVDDTRVTCWRQSSAGLKEWPAGTQYGPFPTAEGTPAVFRTGEFQAWRAHWDEIRQAWHERVAEQLLADPEKAARRFAELEGRCHRCGRVLTDPASVSLGVGPDCQRLLAARWAVLE